MKQDCIFCKIANGEIPAKTLYEDERFRMILDLGHATKEHELYVPKNHAANLYEMPDEDAMAVLPLAKKMGLLMKSRLQCDGLNLVQNNGETAGQTVLHFHLHLIPRYEGGPSMVTWTPGSEKPEVLAETAEKIKEAL